MTFQYNKKKSALLAMDYKLQEIFIEERQVQLQGMWHIKHLEIYLFKSRYVLLLPHIRI